MVLKRCENCGDNDWDDEGDYYVCRCCGFQISKERKPAQPDFKMELLNCLEKGEDNPTTLVGYVHKVCDADPKDPLGLLIDAFAKKDKKGLGFEKATKAYFSSKQEEKNFPVVISYFINHLSYGELGHLRDCLDGAGLLDDGCKTQIEEKQEALDKEDNPDLKKTADVFVCYSQADLDKVENTVQAIEREGISCWYSSRDIPQNDPTEYLYENRIKKAIESCKVFLFFASKNSRNSRYVKKEIRIAGEKLGRNRIEYKISSKWKSNAGDFEDFFDGLQWIDASESDQSEVLIERIKAMLSDDSSTEEEAARKAAEEECARKKEEEERKEAELRRQKELEEARAALEEANAREEARRKEYEERKIREEAERREAEAQHQKELEQVRIESAEKIRKAIEEEYARKKEEEERKEAELRHQKELEEARISAEEAKAKAKQEEERRKEAEEKLSLMREEKAKSAESESPKEIFKQGMSLKRQGDYEKAFACFQKGAECGDFKSLFMMAKFYEDGTGVNKDETLAKAYYKKSADAGCIDASYYYAELCFAEDRNSEEGIRYLTNAAEHDHPDAQYELARRYHYGNGVPERSLLSVEWLKRAIVNGSEDARGFMARHYPNEK